MSIMDQKDIPTKAEEIERTEITTTEAKVTRVSQLKSAVSCDGRSDGRGGHKLQQCEFEAVEGG